jgi:hypothetical protein
MSTKSSSWNHSEKTHNINTAIHLFGTGFLSEYNDKTHIETWNKFTSRVLSCSDDELQKLHKTRSRIFQDRKKDSWNKIISQRTYERMNFKNLYDSFISEQYTLRFPPSNDPEQVNTSYPVETIEFIKEQSKKYNFDFYTILPDPNSLSFYLGLSIRLVKEFNINKQSITPKELKKLLETSSDIYIKTLFEEDYNWGTSTDETPEYKWNLIKDLIKVIIK